MGLLFDCSAHLADSLEYSSVAADLRLDLDRSLGYCLLDWRWMELVGQGRHQVLVVLEGLRLEGMRGCWQKTCV